MIVTLSANPQLIGQQIVSALTTPSMPLSIITQAETKWTTIAQTLITNFQATGTIPNASPRVLGLVSPDGTTTITSSNGVLSVPMATTSSLGLVKPDNTTITVSSGILSAATATLSSLGIVEPDGTTITISAGGVISASSVTNTNYFLSYVSGLFDTGVMTGWNLYNDGASVSPVEGTGGVVSNLTFNINSITPLVGAFDARLVLSANNDQGEGLSYDFTVENAAVYQPIFISYYYTTTANYVDGDITLWIYDKTNNVLIAPSNQDIPPAATATYWSGYFIPNSNSTSYRLIYHISSTNTTGYTFELDQVFVGRTNTLIGTAISGWTTYNAFLNLGGGSLNGGAVTSAKWRRIGNSMEIEFYVYQAAGGTAGGSVYYILLPSGYTPVYTTGGIWSNVIGSASLRNPGVNTSVGVVRMDVGGDIFIETIANSGAAGPFTDAVWGSGWYGVNGAGVEVSGVFSVPISQWSTNINLVTDFTEYASNSSSTDANDTTSFVNGSQGAAGIIGVTNITVQRLKRIQFTRPMQATDLIVLEFYSPITGTWLAGDLPVSGTTLCNHFVYATGGGGAYLLPVNGTQIDVSFQIYSDGGHTWNATGTSGCKWRVRKTSQGNFAEQTPTLIMLPRDNTSRMVVNNSAPPAQGAWSSAIQVTGNFGVPAGAKSILASVMVNAAESANNAEAVVELAFSDNNTSTPSGSTAHPHIILDFRNNSGSDQISIEKDLIIPLNGSGQFYTYTITKQNEGGTGVYYVTIKDYYTGGIST